MKTAPSERHRGLTPLPLPGSDFLPSLWEGDFRGLRGNMKGNIIYQGNSTYLIPPGRIRKVYFLIGGIEECKKHLGSVNGTFPPFNSQGRISFLPSGRRTFVAPQDYIEVNY